MRNSCEEPREFPKVVNVSLESMEDLIALMYLLPVMMLSYDHILICQVFLFFYESYNFKIDTNRNRSFLQNTHLFPLDELHDRHIRAAFSNRERPPLL